MFNVQKRSWEDVLPVSHCKKQRAGRMAQGVTALKCRKDACQVPRFGAEHLGRLSPDQGPAVGQREGSQGLLSSPSRP